MRADKLPPQAAEYVRTVLERMPTPTPERVATIVDLVGPRLPQVKLPRVRRPKQATTQRRAA